MMSAAPGHLVRGARPRGCRRWVAGASRISGFGAAVRRTGSSYGPLQFCQIVSVNVPSGTGDRVRHRVHGSKWPISNWVEMFVSSAAQGMMLLRPGGVVLGLIVERRARAVGDVRGHEPVRGRGDHEAALAGGEIVGSASSSACRPRSFASKMWTPSLSPGFIMSVCAFGVTVARLARCGLGGPVGTPLRLDEREVGRLGAVGVAVAKPYRALQVVDVQRRAPVRVVAADASRRTARSPAGRTASRGTSCRRRRRTLAVPGALESLLGLHGVSGKDPGLHSAMLNHGAIDSSNQCVTSLPGCATVGRRVGSNGQRSLQVMSLPEPGRSRGTG